MDKRWQGALVNFGLVLAAIFVALLIAELCVRDYRLGFQNLILLKGGKLVEHHFKGLYSYDAGLGWVPMPNVAKEKWGTMVHTLDDGIRSNGGTPSVQPGNLIMTFGCSFTFGDEVADDQTWSAYLEKLAHVRVLNAGVSSYGLDQSVLRAERLAVKYHPDVVVISLVYNSLDRLNERVRHGVPKPYFDVVDGFLVVGNQPVPFKEHAQMDGFRMIFGHSHLVHKVMARWFPAYWWKDTMQDFQSVHTNLGRVLPLLLQRLEQNIPSGTRIILLVHDNINISETRFVVMEQLLRQMRPQFKRIEVCDLMPAMMAMKRKNPQVFENLFLPPGSLRHYSPYGNAWTAAMLDKFLAGIPPVVR